MEGDTKTKDNTCKTEERSLENIRALKLSKERVRNLKTSRTKLNELIDTQRALKLGNETKT